MTDVLILDVDCLNDDEVFDFHYSRLSNERKKKTDSFVLRKDKNLCVGSGIIIDKKLTLYGLSEKSVTCTYGQYGKPYFKDPASLFFSISHSGHYCAVAFSDKEVGCDIEEITAIEDDVKKLCTSGDEYEELADEKDFFCLWSKKESFLKAKGLGLNVDLRTINSKYISEEFKVFLSDCIKGYSLAVCYKGEDIAKPVFIDLNS